MNFLVLTHDLSCVLENLAKAAARYPKEALKHMTPRDLMTAAVEFTIQLAIDDAGCDPTQMRDLERKLLTRLRGLPDEDEFRRRLEGRSETNAE